VHPILGAPRRLKTFALTWPAVGAALGILPLLWAGGALQDWWAAAIWGEVLALPMLASSYVCRAAPIARAGAGRVFLTVGTAAVLTTAAWLELGRWWFRAVAPLAPSPYERYAQITPPAAVGVALAFVAMSAINYAIAAADERQAAVARALEAEISEREAELRALRSQVDPHFLFNCLHSISALIASDPVTARWMCLELAEFFRESLRAGGQPRVPMTTEVALVRRYLEIERRRFGPRLDVAVTVASDAERALVPPLLLQPLAENAVRHGIATLVDGGRVTIDVARTGERIDMRVENPYDADGRRPGTHVGLTNVRARLDATYGSRASLTLDEGQDRFRAAISIPMEEGV